MAIDKAVDSTQLDADFTTVANAIRTKGGTSEQLSFPSGMAQAVADLPSGGTIENGLVFTQLNSNGEPLSADFYGPHIGEYQFGANVSQSYHYNLDTLNSLEAKNVVTVGSYAFNQSKLRNIIIANTCTSIGWSAFRQNNDGTDIDVTILGNPTFDSYVFYQNTKLRNAQLGSVGYGLTSIPNNTFSYDTQASLTVTAYTDGAHASAILASIRNGATGGTIIIKASETATYNGVSYSAGDTMITSTVEV